MQSYATLFAVVCELTALAGVAYSVDVTGKDSHGSKPTAATRSRAVKSRRVNWIVVMLIDFVTT